LIAIIAHLVSLAIIWSAAFLVMMATAPLWLPLACYCEHRLLDGRQRAAGILSPESSL